MTSARQVGRSLPVNPGTMKPHNLSLLFGAMSASEYSTLRDDIARNGLRTAITTYEGRILDGRHRNRACKELGIPARYVPYKGCDPLSWVVSANLSRRHLSDSQKALLAVELLPRLEAEALKRMRAGRKAVELFPQGRKSREIAGKLCRVNSRYVSEAKRVVQSFPDLVTYIRSGQLNIPEARLLSGIGKRDREKVIAKKLSGERCNIRTEVQRVLHCEILRKAKPLSSVSGDYQVLLVDPPWPGGTSPKASANRYPCMTLEEIMALGKDIESLSSKDSVLFLWITSPMLPHMFPLLESYGFSYKSLLVWDKVINDAGIGRWFRNAHELLAVATRGKFPSPVNVPPSIYREARTRRSHSRKPEGIYAFIEGLWPGVKLHKIELFARSAVPGWDSWGAESEPVKRAPVLREAA